MISFKTYGNYKSSNVEWIDIIPTTWDEIKVKHIFNERSQKGFPDETLLSATQSKGVIPQKSFGQRTVIATKDFENLKLVKKGDFVISLRSFQGGIEISYSRGIISPAYTVMFPSTQISKIYFKHLFKSIGLIQLLKTCVKGIREGQNIDYKMFKNKVIPIPPLKTQIIIAEYLDRKQKQANNFIAKQQKMIELLKEQKKAIINQAVTKGINPNVKMKDSGIEWLGEIPEHWEVRKLKFVSTIIMGQSPEGQYINSEHIGIPFLQGNAEFNELYPEEKLWCSESKKISKINDILFSVRAPVGAVNISNKRFCIGRGLCAISSNKLLYKFAYLCSLNFKLELDKYATGSTFEAVSISDLKNIHIGFPINKEQTQIVKYIESKTKKIDTAISKSEEEIKLTKEYLESLIFNVVTGQIKVEE